MLLPFELFVMLVLANGAPVVAARLFNHHADWPIDGGRLCRDGRALLGASKTWRGLVVGTLACLIFAAWVGLGAGFGALFGLLALLGDLFSSFVKRRRGMSSSARAVWLDQLPESVAPMLMAWLWLPVPLWEAMAIALLFALSNMLFSPLLYRLGIRRQPH
ncbi:CDP-archaeol synthase [Marinobacter sp. SS5-14b]|uniref:CDP-archaeol synthase n=1 Tax=Marinobacter sp. SS5-14b TaxID=3050456 RepID=UPI0026DFA04E|nr:CDP-archaeol synthase [Marinobacter sp. SS5-14b]